MALAVGLRLRFYLFLALHCLYFNEFLQIMSFVTKNNVSDEVLYFFNQFDSNNDGKISRDELLSVMKRLFPEEEFNEHDIGRMLDEADLDQNGTIDYEGNFELIVTAFRALGSSKWNRPWLSGIISKICVKGPNLMNYCIHFVDRSALRFLNSPKRGKKPECSWEAGSLLNQ
jgi:hypothetical protein